MKFKPIWIFLPLNFNAGSVKNHMCRQLILPTMHCTECLARTLRLESLAAWPHLGFCCPPWPKNLATPPVSGGQIWLQEKGSVHFNASNSSSISAISWLHFLDWSSRSRYIWSSLQVTCPYSMVEIKPRLHEQFLCDNFDVTIFICSCRRGKLDNFCVANTVAKS
jgi:hypothetical protein